MPISCFNNLIGIRNLAGEEDPDSGYFLNDLPGITTEKLEDISDQTDHYEPRLAWDDIYNRSIRLMENDMKSAMKKYYKNYSYVKDGITGRIDIKNTNFAAEAFYSGWFFDLIGLNENLLLTIDTVSINVITGTSLTVKIWDAITGDQLFTEDFTVTAGFNTYRILNNIPLWKHRQIFIGYDATTITAKQIERFDMSGHADREELLEFAINTGARAIVLTHGDPEARDWFVNEFYQNPVTAKTKIIDPAPRETVSV